MRLRVVEFLFSVYKRILFPVMYSIVGSGFGCRYEPSCSEYASQSMKEHGIVKGSLFTAKRISRCHPFGSFGYDPVPRLEKNGKGER